MAANGPEIITDRSTTLIPSSAPMNRHGGSRPPRRTIRAMRRTVPYTADEKTTLHAALDRHRDVALWKLDGLDDEQLRRPLLPSGSNLLGLVKHLGAVEYGWFCHTFGRETEPLPFDDDDPDADLRVDANETTADVLAFYG